MPESDIRKAAVVLRSLPEHAAAQLLTRLSPEQAAAVRGELARVSAIAGNEQQAALEAFAAEAVAASRPAKAVDDSAAAVRFDSLSREDAANLRALLSQERPQTIALVLSRLPRALAAELLGAFPADLQSAVVRRIAAIGDVDCDIVRDVQHALAERLAGLPVRHVDKIDGAAAAAGILAFLDQASEHSLLDEIARDEPEMVEDIRQRMFGEIATEATKSSPRLVA